MLTSYLRHFRVSLPIVGGCLLFLGASMGSATGAGGQAIHAAEVLRNFGQVPLRFEENGGQSHPEARFLSRGRGYTLFLTGTEAILALRERSSPPREPAGNPLRRNRGAKPANPHQVQNLLRIVPVGANPNPRLAGENLLPGETSYFQGNQQADWHTGLRSYARVRYGDLYPGIDLVYYGNQGQLEFDFEVAAGGDPGVIRVRFEGAERLELSAEGELLVHLPGGHIRWKAPVAYQQTPAGRREVDCAFVTEGQGEVTFRLGAHDPRWPLTIDPLLTYSTYLGGADQDLAQSIAVDRLGQVYVTGQTDSLNFPTNRAFRGTNAGNAEVFVTKLNASGSALVYSTFLGGARADVAFGIAVDAGGNACVVGRTASANFPTQNPVQSSLNGTNDDAFVVKLGTNGTNLIFSTYFGGGFNESAYGVAVDTGTNNIYVTGETASPSTGNQGQRFPVLNAFQPDHGGFTDAFVAKFNATAATVTYASYLGGGDDDIGRAIAADASGAAYVCGEVLSCDFGCLQNFPVTAALQAAYGGSLSDGFVAKINAAGTAKTWATYLGGTNTDMAFGIAVDAAANVYVAGATSSDNFPVTSNACQAVIGDGNGFTADAFLVKIRSSGATLDYGTYLGGDIRDEAYALAVDAGGNAHLTGVTFSDDFPRKDAGVQGGFGGDFDAFAAMINPALAGSNSLIYSTYLGGPRGEAGNGVCVDTNGNVYVAGQTLGTNTFTPRPGAPQSTYGGGASDAFVTKLTLQPRLQWSRSGTNHLARWPTFPPGFSLVAVTNAQQSNWTAVAGAITSSNGFNQVTVTNAGTRRFLRLRKP
ncbi:MAG: hypothetical protein RJA22_1611 [Verrucomicrobiota bacterium]